MWEICCMRKGGGWRWTRLVFLVTLSVLLSETGGEGSGGGRRGRIVVGSRQFPSGTSGRAEVVSVNPHEFAKLLEEQGIQVVRGGISGVDVNGSTSGGEEVGHAGVSGFEEDVGTTVGSATSAVTSENPVVVAVPEDSSRGTLQGHGDRFVPIDRRKVPGKVDGAGNGELSFTGILNGLLDSFINDPPPQRQPRPPSTTTSTTPQPSQEDISLQDDDEDEEQSPEEETKTDSGKSSPSKPSLSTPQSTTEELSNEQENVSEEPIEEDEDPLDDYLNKDTNSTKQSQNTKQCEGECRNIIFGLFLCDEIDNDAFCPETGLACCVNNPEPEYNRYKPYGNGSSEEDSVHLDNDHDMEKVPMVNTQESNEDLVEEEDLEDDEPQPQVSSQEDQKKQQVQQQPQQQQHRYPYRPPPPPQYNPQSPPPQYYYPPPQSVKNPPMMMHPPPRMPLPCPRYCVKNYHKTYCSEVLPSQFSCGMDAFCCGHPVNPVKEEKQQVANEDDEESDDLYRNEGVGQTEDTEQETTSSVKKIIGPCTEDVGSCVSKNIINIICFAHAMPTDLYTCPRTSMKCCARKTALPKDSLPTTTPAPSVPPNPITRNTSSTFPKPIPPPGPPQILPQFAPQHPPHHHYIPNTQFHQPPPPPQLVQPTHAPTPPPLAETPPPPMGIQPTQFTNQFTSNSIQSRVPSRQPVGQYVCGVKGVPSVSKRRRKRVVGGSDALPGEWCWQVALINSLNQYLCGGALIGTQWVLTAAHCVTNIVRSGDAIYVRVGDHDLTSRYGSPGAQTLRVATTYIHHNHNSQTLDNDIALLKLQGNAALKEGVCLVCLPSRNHMSEIPGKMCTVTGYGYTSESGPIPLKIREASIPIVSDEECVRNVNAVTEKVFALPMSSFCAGGDDSGNDACQGDGGGPLVCRADDPTTGDTGTGYYELTGLVSWGFGCSRSRVPGVYVKVSSFIGWIHQIIRSN